jgi:hypothetical protein
VGASGGLRRYAKELEAERKSLDDWVLVLGDLRHRAMREYFTDEVGVHALPAPEGRTRFIITRLPKEAAIAMTAPGSGSNRVLARPRPPGCVYCMAVFVNATDSYLMYVDEIMPPPEDAMVLVPDASGQWKTVPT